MGDFKSYLMNLIEDESYIHDVLGFKMPELSDYHTRKGFICELVGTGKLSIKMDPDSELTNKDSIEQVRVASVEINNALAGAKPGNKGRGKGFGKAKANFRHGMQLAEKYFKMFSAFVGVSAKKLYYLDTDKVSHQSICRYFGIHWDIFQ